MVNLYCTADTVSSQSGGGLVTANEWAAFQQLGPSTLIDGRMIPVDQGPFITDYYAEQLVAKILRKDRIKIAHFYSGSFTKTVRTLKAAGAKVSYTVAAHDLNESIKEYKTLGLDYPFTHMTDPAKFEMYSDGYRESDLVICPSKLSADIMSRSGCRKVEVVPHGIESLPKVKPLPKMFTVGYLGQTGPDKGWLYLLKAWAKLGYTDAQLVMAGPRISQIVPYIRKYGGGNVRLLGFVPSPSDLYDLCTVYVQPSVTEGFGIEVLEAMAHGRAVIASTGAGAAEVISEGNDGLLFQPRDVNELASLINHCRKNQATMDGLRNRAVKKAAQYTWDSIRYQYISLWTT